MTTQTGIPKDLLAVREQIDSVDRQLLELFSQRASLALRVAEIKTQSDDPAELAHSDFYRPAREAQILRFVQENNPGPLDGKVVARLFREVISSCLALEGPLKVAFLGPAGTFSEEAAYKHFGQAINAQPQIAIDEIFQNVESGEANYGVVPIENSAEGVITRTLDELLRSPLKICGEVSLRIHHQLLTQAKDLASVKTVYGHAQALGQCRRWLDANLPSAERVPVSSNAEGARRAAGEAGAAGIAGESAGQIYKLPILAANIEDEHDNTTRFLVVGRQEVPRSGNDASQDMTSIAVSASNRPGLLQSLIQPLSTHGVSMTRIESRPSRKEAWDYVFFIDIHGHSDDPKVKAALDDMREVAHLFKVLGSYPTAVL